jgi:peptide/nickel transport system permease protein
MDDIKIVVLWTDGLLFLLLGLALFSVFNILKNPYLRDTWREVFRSKISMSAFVILIFYIVVGFLDSLHFRTALPSSTQSKETHYSVEVYSVLDVIFSSVRENQEKTYSAPFAATQLSKESIEQPDGSFKREYPRLEYGGSHLKPDLSDKTSDILYRSFIAILWAVLIWGIIVALVSIKVKRIWSGDHDIPWHVALITTGILILCISWFVQMSSGYHVFGTDKVGQDVLYQAVKSIRTGLIIGSITTLIMLPLAIMLGIMAGYFRGWVDDIIQYLYTTLNSIPSVLLIAAAILTLNVYIDSHADLFQTEAQRADMRLLFLCMILGITSWTGLCRLLRAETLKLRELGYVQAAQVFGVSKLQIIKRHFLPNLMHIVLITIVIDFSILVLAEAVLSYLGIGVDPSTSSWGNMINAARLELAREPVVWWSLAAAFIFMFVLVLAANLFSDAVRRAFDPRGNS